MQYSRSDFPADFLFGVTGPDQVETAPQTFDTLRDTGFDCVHIALNWAQVSPADQGQTTPDALAHYDRLIDALLERGLRPSVVLYDGTLPPTLLDQGGWRNRDICHWFTEYTETAMGHLGDRVYSVAPFNPRQTLRAVSFASDPRTAARSVHHMLLAQSHALGAMRGLGLTNLGAMASLSVSNDIVLSAFSEGVLDKAYSKNTLTRFEPHLPTGWQDDFASIGTKTDWLGLSFDAPNALSALPPTPLDQPLVLINEGHRDADFTDTLAAVHGAVTLGASVQVLIMPWHKDRDLSALKPLLAGSNVAVPLAQGAGSLRDHWNLVADIGGTNTRLGVVTHGKLTDLRKYPTGTLPDLLNAFHSLRDEIGTDPRAVVAAGAGPVRGGVIRLTNANLDLAEDDIGGATGAQHTFVINDFTAAAWSVAEITGDDVEVLQGAPTPPTGTRLVVGPGTGLGVGALLYSEGRYHTASGEGGHIGLSPRHADEVDIFRAARQFAPECFFDDTLVLEAEMFLSGTGLPILYRAAQLASGQSETTQRSARDILEDARAGTDPIAIKTAELFTTHLGAVMGDLAVVLMPAGGVFLVGGVAEKNRWLFGDSFRAAFNAGGRFSDLRQSFNLYVSEQDEFGIVGANNFCKAAIER